MKYTIYHNPRCTKSRQALAYLQEKGAEIEIIEYLKTNPSESEITALLQKLDIPAIDLVRKEEALFKEQYKDKELSEKEWIKILSENPVLIQRPVVVKGDKAVIGRPLERIFLLLSFLLLSVAGLWANDGAYYMSGNQLIPIKNTDIYIQKEVLTIKKVNERFAQVNVYYEFFNTQKEQDVLVGFEALTPQGDVDGRPKNGGHPNMREFSVMVNDSLLNYDVAIVWDKGYLDSGIFTHVTKDEIIESGDNYNYVGYLYVYHFNARLKKGLNIVRHSYMFDLSRAVDFRFGFDYKLSASRSWGNGTIKDFTLVLDFGDFEEFHIDSTFSWKVADWTLSGIGSIKTGDVQTWRYNESIPYLGVKITRGVLVYQKKDFVPSGELYVWAWNHFPGNDVFDYREAFLPYPIEQQDRVPPPNDDISRKILCSLPYARRGCMFDDTTVQDYYNGQDWYKPNPKAVPDFEVLTHEEQIWLQNLQQ